jgi:hypothetical protein
MNSRQIREYTNTAFGCLTVCMGVMDILHLFSPTEEETSTGFIYADLFLVISLYYLSAMRNYTHCIKQRTVASIQLLLFFMRLVLLITGSIWIATDLMLSEGHRFIDIMMLLQLVFNHFFQVIVYSKLTDIIRDMRNRRLRERLETFVNQRRSDTELSLTEHPELLQLGLTPTEFSLLESNCQNPSRQSIGDCAICLAEVQGATRLMLPMCTHIYHMNCIRSWLMLKPTCPICKRNVREYQFAQRRALNHQLT